MNATQSAMVMLLVCAGSVGLASEVGGVDPKEGAAPPTGDINPQDPPQKELQEFRELKVHFAFSDNQLTDAARDELQKAARLLKKEQNLRVTVTGHADERGSSEFNLALGEQRAVSVRQYLADLGVDAARVRVISYGEERPLAPAHNEDAWAANRRTEFIPEGELTVVAAAVTAPAAPPATASTGASASKDSTGTHGRNAPPASSGGRRFAWLPVWLGPVFMVAALPVLALAVPFVVSMLYMGPSLFSGGGPTNGREPVVTSGGTPGFNSGSGPGDWIGSVWSVIYHGDTAAAPMNVGVLVVGIGGAVVSTGLALGLAGVGAGLLAASLVPGESADAPAPAP